MKMPLKNDLELFAPCGVNCLVCYKHCYVKIPCAGCLTGDNGKLEHCRKCKIKDCVKEKELNYCYECNFFPCKLIKKLKKSYNIRYNASLIKNSILVKEKGIEAFMNQQTKLYTCSKCGGIISIHDQECSECQVKIIP